MVWSLVPVPLSKSLLQITIEVYKNNLPPPAPLYSKGLEKIAVGLEPFVECQSSGLAS
jgi:hypothetical protein